MRILIAEDDPVSRLMLQATLRKWGHDPIVCCDGKEALAVLESDSFPDIAILDWMMPEMDGPEVCRRIRQKSTATPAYIILLTAKIQRADIVAGLGAGADDYVTKPFHPEELYARIQVGIRITDLQRKLADRVRDLEIAMMRLRGMQQTQKLKALGQLASGVAHEINTPTQFIGDNIRFLETSWAEIAPVLEQQVAGQTNGTDLSYLTREIPKAIEDSLHGIQRVGNIVRAMREFARPPAATQVHADINRAIETTITVAGAEWKDVADIQTDLDPQLPQPLCLPGEIQQVLLHLIINAAQAIDETAAESNNKGLIRIATSRCGDWIEIRVSDTGTGIREEHTGKIFQPFFTTKDVGKGAGQGLAIAHSIIVQQHHGKIWFESLVGMGTTFFVRLPIEGVNTKEGEYEEMRSVS